MHDDENLDSEHILNLTSKIVAAFVARNTVHTDELSELIRSVHNSLTNISAPIIHKEPEHLKPAVSIKKSITPEYIICLEDGKKLKMLKRYLRTNFNMSPEDYRAKWNLPPDYPMVAPDYADLRSNFAKKIGLGKNQRKSLVRKKLK